MMDSVLANVAMAASIVLIGFAGPSSAVADEKYDKGTFKDDCEVTGGVSGCAPGTIFAAQRPATQRAQYKPPKPRPRFKPGIKRLPRRVCPDPAAYRLTFRIVTRTGRHRGRVEIVGIVKNVSRGAYVTRVGQQGIQLWEGRRMVRTLDFGNLAPGQMKVVRYRRNWNASSPTEGEFPPTYKLQIIYDPDITKDGNRGNDDCRGTNNRLQRSGQGINAMLR